MATNSKIEWTEATWNPLAGCTRDGPDCDHCYAATMTARLESMGNEKYSGLTVLNARGQRHFNGKINLIESALTIPLKRRKPTVYFVNSMSDLFHKDVPFDFIDKVFAIMALCPQHIFQVLSKRSERMAEYMESRAKSADYWKQADRGFGYTLEFDTGEKKFSLVRFPLPNAWLGTSCGNQETADRRIPPLLRVPAAVRFLSVEPLIGPVDLEPYLYPAHDRANWTIVGGESGHGARPCNIEWIRSIVRQCAAASVPCFVKQFGARPVDGTRMSMDHDRLPLNLSHPKGGDPSEWPEDLRVRQMPTAAERVT